MSPTMTAEAAEQALEQEIAAARAALLVLVRRDPERWWTARELKVGARNGWSSSAMALALGQLVDERILEQRRDFRVRLRA